MDLQDYDSGYIEALEKFLTEQEQAARDAKRQAQETVDVIHHRKVRRGRPPERARCSQSTPTSSRVSSSEYKGALACDVRASNAFNLFSVYSVQYSPLDSDRTAHGEDPARCTCGTCSRRWTARV